jgi:hypothetical protein
MMSGLLIRVRQRDERSVIVGPSHERDAGWEVVASKTGRNYDGRNEDETGVEGRDPFLIYKGRVDSVFDHRRLVLDRLDPARGPSLNPSVHFVLPSSNASINVAPGALHSVERVVAASID